MVRTISPAAAAPLPARAPPEIPSVSQSDDPPIARGESLDNLPGIVGRAIVDQNQLEGDAGRFQNVGDGPVQRRDVAFFVHRGDDHSIAVRLLASSLVAPPV